MWVRYPVIAAALVVSSLFAVVSVSANGQSQNSTIRGAELGEAPGAFNMSPELRELRKVQTAFDRFMADYDLDQVLATPISTNEIYTVTLWVDESVSPPQDLILTQKYIRQAPTQCSYIWDAFGVVQQTYCP